VVRNVQADLPGQFLLDAQAPGPDSRNLSCGIDRANANGETQPAGHELRTEAVQVARGQLRCVGQRRIAEAVKVGVVLTLPFEKLADSAAHRCPAIAEHIPRETESRRDLVFAMLDATSRDTIAFNDHAIERVSGSGNDGALGRAIGRLD